MKIGPNEPCPCGSGKKYKKCCWNKEFVLKKVTRELDNLYASLKGYNNELLHKANSKNYEGANFTDAIDLAITSNALSLIKGILQNNHYSITNALNLRNLIECYALLEMDKKGDISDTQKLLFVEQYKLIEYESYAKGGTDKYKSMLDLNDLEARYLSGKEKFLEVVGSESKLKRIINSRLPFLCDEKLNYNILIEKYCPSLLTPYVYLSRMIHPTSYESFRNIDYYVKIFGKIVKTVTAKYKDRTPKANELTYFKEQAVVYGFGMPTDDNYGQKLYDIQKAQWQLLKKVADEFQSVYGEQSYVKNFLVEVSLVLYDINTDSQLGYTENVKLKFKVIAEMFACFHRVYFSLSNEEEDYFYKMLLGHDLMKVKEQAKQEVTDDEKEFTYKKYLQNYPSSKLTKEEFFKEFNKPLGFFVDGEGKTPTFGQLVDEYLDKQYKDDPMANNKIKIKDFYKVVYKESNNMSHGCGYLFFSNIGAWMDDINVLQFLDNSIMYFLLNAGAIFFAYAQESENNKKISELLQDAYIEMENLIKSKMKILTEIKRIPKFF